MQNNLFFFEPYQTTIEHLCKRYRITRLYAFGSVLTDSFGEASDIDLLFEFERTDDPITDGLRLWEFWNEVEEVLGRKVDFLENKTFENSYFNQVVHTQKSLIYAA